MPDQVPSTIDTSGSDLTQVTPNTVRPSLKDRIMGTIAGTVNSATGGDPNAKTPLQTAIDKHHSQMADEANMHQRNYANYATGHLLTLQGINPETQQRFDDPTYKGPSQADMEAKYRNYRDSAHQMYLKSAGKTPELKKAIQTQGDLINHVGNAIATQQSPGNAAGNAARATAPAGGLQPPPGAGSSPAAPGTTSSSATGGAAISPSDEGNPGASGGLTPPPKSDAGPAAAATPPAPTPATQAGVPPPPTPPANEPYDPMTAIAQARVNKRAEAIAEEGREDKRDLGNFSAKQKVLHDYKVDELKEAAKARAANPTGRASALKPISMEKARTLAKGGALFNAADPSMGDETGNLDVNSLPDDMMLVPLQQNGHVVVYGIADQAQKRLVYNGNVVVVPEFEQTQANDKGTTLGASQIPMTSTHTEPGIDAAGNAATLVKTTTRTPQRGAGPPTSSPAPAGASSPPTQTSSPSSVPPPTTGNGKTASPTSFQAGSAPKGSGGGVGGGKPAVFTPGQYNTMRKVYTPLMEASTQIFGDPNDPNYKSLESFQDIADDPKESAALAVAVRRSIAGLDEKMKGAGTGITDLIKNQSGFTNELIASQAQADRDAIGGLSPRNQQAYASIMSALGAMIGVRAATGGSAAKFSALALEREIPIPGVNSFSKAQFNKQLNGIAAEIKRGSKGVPIFGDDERANLAANQARTGIAAVDKAGGGDTVTVQIPGYPAKPILRSRLDDFQRKYPNAKVIK